MAIFLDSDSTVIVQGITGSEGTKHPRRMVASARRSSAG
jgi:succinyl-CoA synthetase alpha subunit